MITYQEINYISDLVIIFICYERIENLIEQKLLMRNIIAFRFSIVYKQIKNCKIDYIIIK